MINLAERKIVIFDKSKETECILPCEYFPQLYFIYNSRVFYG